MTEPTPDRTIGGLSRRTTEPNPSVAGMLKRNRQPATGDLDTGKSEPLVTEPVADAGKSESSKAESAKPRRAPAKPARKASTPRSAAADAPKEQVSGYVSATVRNRARAAYKATGHLEDDASFSEFIETALLAETVRREHLYNDGLEYSGDTKKLAPGRPLS